MPARRRVSVLATSPESYAEALRQGKKNITLIETPENTSAEGISRIERINADHAEKMRLRKFLSSRNSVENNQKIARRALYPGEFFNQKTGHIIKNPPKGDYICKGSIVTYPTDKRNPNDRRYRKYQAELSKNRIQRKQKVKIEKVSKYMTKIVRLIEQHELKPRANDIIRNNIGAAMQMVFTRETNIQKLITPEQYKSIAVNHRMLDVIQTHTAINEGLYTDDDHGHRVYVKPLDIFNAEDKAQFCKLFNQALKDLLKDIPMGFVETTLRFECFIEDLRGTEYGAKYLNNRKDFSMSTMDCIVHSYDYTDFIDKLLGRFDMETLNKDKFTKWQYHGVIGFDLSVLKINRAIGNYIPTPAVFLGAKGKCDCLVNIQGPTEDDNLCLPRCLIYGLKSGVDTGIKKNATNYKRYESYWFNHDSAHLLNGHTIQDVMQIMCMTKGQPFEYTPKRIVELEDYLDVYIDIYECVLDKDNSDTESAYKLYPGSNSRDRTEHREELNLCVLVNSEGTRHCCYIRNLANFKQRLNHFSQVMSNHESRLIKCPHCDFCTTYSKVLLTHTLKVHPDKVNHDEIYDLGEYPTKLRFRNRGKCMVHPVCIYYDYESSLTPSEQGTVHKPIMCTVYVDSQLDGVQSECKTFYADGAAGDETFTDMIKYMNEIAMKTQQIVCNQNYPDYDRNSDFRACSFCPYCNCKLVSGDSDFVEYCQLVGKRTIARKVMNEDLRYTKEHLQNTGKPDSAEALDGNIRPAFTRMDKQKLEDLESTLMARYNVRTMDDIGLRVIHHAHYSGPYYNGNEIRKYKAGEVIAMCCSRCNLSLKWNPDNFQVPCYAHNFSGYEASLIMDHVAKTTNQLEKTAFGGNDYYDSLDHMKVIPTTMDKSMAITTKYLQFKDTLRMLSSSLKALVETYLGTDLTRYRTTIPTIRDWCTRHGKPFDESYVELMLQKEPMFYNLVTSIETLNTKGIPKREDIVDELTGKTMDPETYAHMQRLWDCFKVQDWREYYELYNVMDVTLLCDVFNVFRGDTLQTFGVDPANYLTTAQLSYDMFFKHISDHRSRDTIERNADTWALYILKTNQNEDKNYAQLVKYYTDSMLDFYANGGITTYCTNDMNPFMNCLNNLRGGLTQICTRYADLSDEILKPNKSEIKDIKNYLIYADCNNLYPGSMHLPMPYEYNGTKDIPDEPNEWILNQSLFNDICYFVDCDIEVPTELHDKFNDLPFFPEQLRGKLSQPMKEFAIKHSLKEAYCNSQDESEVRESPVKKLICTLTNKEHYFTHYMMLKLAVQQGYRITKIHSVDCYKQAPYIYAYVHILAQKRALATTKSMKNICKALGNSLFGKTCETGLKRIKVEIATNYQESTHIVNHYGLDSIESFSNYPNFGVFKIANPKKTMRKPLFVGFAVLDLSKYIVYNLYYNALKSNFKSVTLMGQDTDSLICMLSDPDPAKKILELYSYFDYSELKTNSYEYQKLVEYYKDNVRLHEQFPTLESFINYNKKVPGPIVKDEHGGHRILKFCGLRPKMYCLIDEIDVVHNASKGVSKNSRVASKDSEHQVANEGAPFNIKCFDTYLRALRPEVDTDAEQYGTSKRFSNKDYHITTVQTKKCLLSCLDNKRYVTSDNVHTLAWGHKDIPIAENEAFIELNPRVENQVRTSGKQNETQVVELMKINKDRFDMEYETFKYNFDKIIL